MVRRDCVIAVLFPLLSLAACGGGGGGTIVDPPPASTTARVAANDVEIPVTTTVADLTVRFATTPTPPPALLELEFELPPTLTLPAAARLQNLVPMPSLDGDFVNARFRVLCGDAQNVAATPLRVGQLFQLRLQPTLPRAPGNHTVRVIPRRAAAADGAEVPLDPSPVSVTVTIR